MQKKKIRFVDLVMVVNKKKYFSFAIKVQKNKFKLLSNNEIIYFPNLFTFQYMSNIDGVHDFSSSANISKFFYELVNHRNNIYNQSDKYPDIDQRLLPILKNLLNNEVDIECILNAEKQLNEVFFSKVKFNEYFDYSNLNF